MTERTAPDTIYLQWGDYTGVTWSDEQVGDDDIEYTRKPQGRTDTERLDFACTLIWCLQANMQPDDRHIPTTNDYMPNLDEWRKLLDEAAGESLEKANAVIEKVLSAMDAEGK